MKTPFDFICWFIKTLFNGEYDNTKLSFLWVEDLIEMKRKKEKKPNSYIQHLMTSTQIYIQIIHFSNKIFYSIQRLIQF